MCCKYRLQVEMSLPVEMYKWHHVCYAVDLHSMRSWLAYDDLYREATVKTESPEQLNIAGGGRFVMNQDLDNIEGGFNVRQSVHNDVAQLLLYREVLPPAYLKAYVKCQEPETNVKPFLYFDEGMTMFTQRGRVRVSVAPLESLCQEDASRLVMLPEKMNFDSAFAACSGMKGLMAIPTSEEENTQIFDEFFKFNDLCVDSFGTLYWLGFKGDLNTDEWLTVNTNQHLTWDKLATGFDKVKAGQLCASVGGADFPYDWYSTPCQYLMCPLCNFTATPSFRVRGLCKDSVIDRNLFLRDYENNKPQFHGPHFTGVSWDRDNATWKLTSRGHENLTGYMVMKVPTEYPVGVHSWIITGDKCVASELEVLITACGEEEYTCNDGACISKTQRCDLATNCPDRSDELNCHLAQIPSGYSLEMPPPKDQNTPVPVRILVEITSVRKIDILGFKMVLDIILRLFWRDGRLSMKNLRKDLNSNKVQDLKKLWIPLLQVEDGARSLADLLLRSESLLVQREGSPTADDDSRLYEDDVYLGSENTMMLYQVYTVDFTCQFQLRLYPFDSQVCSVAFSLIGVSPSFVILDKEEDGVIFTGKKKLLEYEVTSFTMTPVDDPLKSGQRVSLKLKNLSGYYISSTYVPTLLLVTICYLTLYFDIADFTDRVMVSLTSLLVLAALFSQTSQSIPKTAYLKLIDLWFVFLIVVEFVIVLVLVIVENMRLRKNKVFPSNVTVISVTTASGDKFPAETKKRHVEVNRAAVLTNTLAKVLLPSLITLFILGYAIVCYVASR
ncbi:uncharacterized protein LOC121865318 [Homarus americanus]|uniref:uncharacterized protein LOC121865318 n=1 Tax=Homarus americanus TaxID=6706 RepID=UPI001C43F8FA|nr:uncharacterized protein LOC121865318 [Homarus americanus]